MAGNTIKVDLPGYGSVNIDNVATEDTLQKILDSINKLNKSTTSFHRSYGSAKPTQGGSSGAGSRSPYRGTSGYLNTFNNHLKNNSKHFNNFNQHLGKGNASLGSFSKSATGAVAKLNVAAYAVGVLAGSFFALGSKSAALIREFSNVGDSLSSAAGTLKNIPLVGGHLSEMFGAVAEQSEKLVRSYQAASSAGVTFGGSVHTMARAATDAGLTFGNFTNLIKQNSTALSMMGYTAEAGAARLAGVSKSIRNSAIGDQLLSLGYTTEELNSGILSYVKSMRSSSVLGSMSTQQLATSSARYLKELDTLARITGQTRQEKEAEMDALRNDAQFRLFMAERGEVAGAEFEKLITMLPKQLQEGAKDFLITGGAVQTEQGRAFATMYGEVGKGLLTARRNIERTGQLTEKDMRMMGASFEKDKKHLIESGIVGTVKFTDGALREVVAGVASNFSEQTVIQSQAEQSRTKSEKNLAKTLEKSQQKIAGASNEMSLALAKPEMIEQLAETFVTMSKVIQSTVVPIFDKVSSVITSVINIANSLFNTFVNGIDKFKLMLDSWWLNIKEFWYDLKDLIPGLKDATVAERKALADEQAALLQRRKNLEEELAKKEKETTEKEKKDQAALTAERLRREKEFYDYKMRREAGTAGGAPGALPAAGSSAPPAGSYSAPAGAAGVGALLSAISKAEGTTDVDAKRHGLASGYDVTLGYGKYGGGPKKALSTMTLSEVKEYQKQMLADPKNKLNSSAVGKYQVVSETLKMATKALGIKDTDVFSAEVQEKVGEWLVKQRGFNDFKSGKISAQQFQNNLAKEWASLPQSHTGVSRYGQKTGMSSADLQNVMATAKSGSTAASASSPGATQIAQEVTNQAAASLYAQTQAAINQGVKYKMGARSVASGQIDCSGWVQSINTNLMKQINREAGKEVFDQSALRAVQGTAESIITQVASKTGVMLTDPAAIKAGLQEGMIIGEDNANSKHDKDRKLGIDHIVQIVRDQVTGQLMVSQSSSGKGVSLMGVEQYFAHAQRKGKKLYATNPMAMAAGGAAQAASQTAQISYPVPSTPGTHQAMQHPLGGGINPEAMRAKLRERYMQTVQGMGPQGAAWGIDTPNHDLLNTAKQQVKEVLLNKINKSNANKYVKKGLEQVVKQAEKVVTTDQLNKAVDYNGPALSTPASTADSQMAAVKQAYREWEEVESKIKEKERKGFTADKVKGTIESDAAVRQEEEKARAVQQQEMLNKQPDMFGRFFGGLSDQLGQLVNVSSSAADTNYRQLSVQKDMANNALNTLF